MNDEHDDPLLIHGHPHPPERLARLSFLIGDFQGEGWFGNERSRVHKRVRGAWVAECRHLTLDMTVDYLLGDGRIDRHGAFVVVSESGGRIEARAYTDAGARRDFVLDTDGDSVEFDDRVPRQVDGTAARKRLSATARGYDEVLDVVRADGKPLRCSFVRLIASPPTGTTAGGRVWAKASPGDGATVYWTLAARPPCRCTMRWTTASPIPVPAYSSAAWRRSKTPKTFSA